MKRFYTTFAFKDFENSITLKFMIFKFWYEFNLFDGNGDKKLLMKETGGRRGRCVDDKANQFQFSSINFCFMCLLNRWFNWIYIFWTSSFVFRHWIFFLMFELLKYLVRMWRVREHLCVCKMSNILNCLFLNFNSLEFHL